MARNSLKHQLESLGEKSWHYVFTASLKITLIIFVPFLLFKFVRIYSDENLSASELIESRIIFDYIAEGLFYILIFWMIASFSCLLIWMNSNSSKKINR